MRGEGNRNGERNIVSTRRGGRQICPRAACTSRQVITRLQGSLQDVHILQLQTFSTAIEKRQLARGERAGS